MQFSRAGSRPDPKRHATARLLQGDGGLLTGFPNSTPSVERSGPDWEKTLTMRLLLPRRVRPLPAPS